MWLWTPLFSWTCILELFNLFPKLKSELCVNILPSIINKSYWSCWWPLCETVWKLFLRWNKENWHLTWTSVLDCLISSVDSIADSQSEGPRSKPQQVSEFELCFQPRLSKTFMTSGWSTVNSIREIDQLVGVLWFNRFLSSGCD